MLTRRKLLACSIAPAWALTMRDASSASPAQVPPLAGATDSHVHIFDPENFPYAAARRYTPPPATVGDLRKLQALIGTERVVCVQPSVYGTDNRCLVHALQQLGALARGIAVIDSSTSNAELKELVDAGVRGVRINLEVDKDRDVLKTRDVLRRVSDQVAGHNLLIQVYGSLSLVTGCAEVIASLPQRVLVDHFGLAKAAWGTQTPEFRRLIELLQHDRVFMKLSGPYQISEAGPAYADTAAIGAALVAAAPSRVVWGSDWPHTGGANRPTDYKPTDLEPFRVEDDRRNFDLIGGWALDAPSRKRLLVDNPAELFGF